MSTRSFLTLLLKTAVCAAALWWVARGVVLEEFIASWTAADPVLLLVAIAIFLLTPVLQGVRLRRLLVAQGIELGTGESIRLAFAGNFMNFAVPLGSTSGDVYKAAVLGTRTDRPWQATATTFVDRAIGTATLLVTVTAIAVLSGPESRLAPVRGPFLLLCAGLVAGFAVLRWLPIEGPRSAWTRRIPARTLVIRAALAARGSLATPRVLALAVLDTLGIQIAAAASFLCAAIALGFVILPHDGFALYAFFSTGEIVKALPGPPQGLGTLEAAYGYFFRGWATPAAILSAAVAIRAINLICSLPGAVAAVGTMPAFGRRGRRREAAPAPRMVEPASGAHGAPFAHAVSRMYGAHGMNRPIHHLATFKRES